MYMYMYMYIYRLDVESKDIRDFKGRGPWHVASERSEDATKGPRPLKSRISFDSTSYLFRFVRLRTRIQRSVPRTTRLAWYS